MTMGRPTLKVTDKDRKQVESLSGFGVPIEQISALTCDGIDVKTLTKYFKKELISGKAKANSKVGQTLFQKATGGDTSAMIWWSKTQMRWSESQAINQILTDGAMTTADYARAIESHLMAGEISVSLANDGLAALANVAKIVESTELLARLETLEELAALK
jgi:hypothetical protein